MTAFEVHLVNRSPSTQNIIWTVREFNVSFFSIRS